MAADASEMPGTVVADKYRLTRMLGRGGMGAVWEGVHVDLGTRVAVKFIDEAHASSDELRQRFVNEAKAAARLRSKHVVQVYDQGVLADGRPYIVMEFLAGEPLDARLDRVGRLPIADTATVLLQVARALSRAHESGVVHRDLKPENVFLVWDDEDHMDVAKVVDFGIAKFTDTGDGTSSSTRTGAVLGTPHFMSPEQARGLRTVDRRTDLWALGVIAYRCVVGELPFEGVAVGDLLVKVCTEEPVPPSARADGVPPELDGWMARALAKDPDARFQTAQELAEAFCAVAGLDPRVVVSGPLSSGRGGPVIEVGRTPVHGEGTAAPLTTTLGGSKTRRSVLLGALAVAALAAGVGLTVARSGGGGGAVHAEPAAAGTEPAPAEPGPQASARAAAPAVEPAVVPSVEVPSAEEERPPAPAAVSAAPAEPKPPAPRKPAVPVTTRKAPAVSAPSEKPAPKRTNTDVLGY
jgi:eukaryotic-like serine/threonine-protein kinase